MTRIMRFTRVPFGNSASPFLLNATIQFHLEKYDSTDSTVTELEHNLYVDDWLSGCDTLEQSACHIRRVNEIMSTARMHFAKWAINCAELATNTPVELNSKINVDEDQKILGLKWDPRLDGFLVYSEKPVLLRKLTKRIALSLISMIFDPLGFFTPFLIRAKIVFQSFWAYQLEWDSPLPAEESVKIMLWLSEVEGLKDFSIPRQFFPGVKWTDVVKLELHVFCDASPLAYDTVIYMCGIVQEGDHTKDENRHDKLVVSFCISKARVAPVKTETLPRQELTACVLGCRMSKYVTHTLTKWDIATFFWTDSKIYLGWINQGAQKCKAYVGNRVKEIIECAPARFWQYCPTEKSPADLVTNGISVNTFLNSDVWVRGTKELLDRQVTFVPEHSSVALTSEGRPPSTEAVLGSAVKPQSVN